MKFPTVFVVAFFLLTKAFAYDVDYVLGQLQDKERTLRMVSFDFKQDVEFLGMGKKSIIGGEAVFSKDGKMIVSRKIPTEQMTVFDGKKLFVYTPAYGQVWEGRWNGWADNPLMPKGLVPIGNFVTDLKKNFVVALASSTEDLSGTLELKATPKDAGLGFSLGFVVSTDSWLPVQTSYVSESAVVVTDISNMVENPSVSDKAFKFTPPPGTDVIMMK